MRVLVSEAGLREFAFLQGSLWVGPETPQPRTGGRGSGAPTATLPAGLGTRRVVSWPRDLGAPRSTCSSFLAFGGTQANESADSVLPMGRAPYSRLFCPPCS